jgi:hypothetical protein
MTKPSYKGLEMDKEKNIIPNHEMEMLFFTTSEGQIQVEAYFDNENFWITQAKMAELFNVDISGISRHISNIFSDSELDENNNLQFLQTVNSKKPVAFYSLDVVIAVGYRAKSPRATDFRKWATGVLHEYIQKGYAMNDERLKQGYHFDKSYFKQLIERIREIRISERQLYLQVTDIFDIAEQRAERQIPTDMGQWLKIMDGYLDLNEYPKLQHAGRISRKDANEKALAEYAEFRIKQDKEFIGDYEREIMKHLPREES